MTLKDSWGTISTVKENDGNNNDEDSTFAVKGAASRSGCKSGPSKADGRSLQSFRIEAGISRVDSDGFPRYRERIYR